MPDGWHMLVFLAPISVDAADVDKGNMATLPDRSHVNLRETFPASGCYEVGSTTPIWTAPWEGADGWSVSDDSRFLVRWNYRPVGTFDGWNGELDWLVKFYDQGKEIRSYTGNELIDYPRLIPLDSQYQFFSYADENLKINGYEFTLITATHESYLFDIRTGEILREYRMWRAIARVVWTAVAVVVTFCAWRLLRWQSLSQPSPVANSNTSNEPATPGYMSARRLGYSLRTLLIITTGIAVLCWIVPRYPHVLVFLTALLVTFWLGYLALRYRRRSRGFSIGRRKRAVGIGARFTAACMAALVSYFLSAGPVLAIADQFRAPDDVRMAIALTVYRPLLWLPRVVEPNRWLDRYFDAWR